jgi:hypothetical protein
LRIGFSAAALSRRSLHEEVENRAFVVDPLSTARQSQNRAPAITSAISSSCYRNVVGGRRRRSSRANISPNFKIRASHRLVGNIQTTFGAQICEPSAELHVDDSIEIEFVGHNGDESLSRSVRRILQQRALVLPDQT